MKIWRVLIALTLSLLQAENLYADLAHSHDLEWLSRDSPHFRIHYNPAQHATAIKVLTIAETVHQRLSPWLDWQPQEPTEILLSDGSDLSNGWSSPLPYNQMTLYLAAPDEVNALEDHHGWLEMLITHEYLHVLHLDMRHGSPATLQRLFGRLALLFPQAWQPAWLHEGLATYLETDNGAAIGRGQSSYYRMLMRMELLAGFKPLRQVNQPLASWPLGSVPYLYGVWFFQFLHANYGEAAIQQLLQSYSDNLIPFRINSNAETVLGKDLSQLWDEFHHWLKPLLLTPELRQLPVAAGEAISDDGYLKSAMTLDRANGDLYFSRDDGVNATQLMRLRAGANHADVVTSLIYGSRLNLHATAGILLMQPQRCDNANLYYDLYRIDLTSGDKTRLTECGRYRRAIWSSDGKSIIAVQQQGGESRLLQLDAAANPIKTLWQGTNGDTLGEINSHPQQNRLIASRWQRDTGWDLYEFDLTSERWQQLTFNQAIESAPIYSPDGNSTLFSADYNGVYNLYQRAPASGELWQLTDRQGGAFMPQQQGESLLYLAYSGRGFDLYRTPVQRNNPISLPENKTQPITTAVTQPPLSAVQRYQPYSTLRPRAWFPLIYLGDNRSEWGFSTSGHDILQRHNYSLSFSYDSKNQWHSEAVNYLYDRWKPLFKLAANRWISHDNLEVAGESLLLRARRREESGATMVLPWLSVESTTALHVGIGATEERDHWLLLPELASPDFSDRYAGVALTYNSSRRHPLNSSISEGQQLLLSGQSSDPFAHSHFKGERYLFDYQLFSQPFNNNQQLAVNLSLGHAAAGARPFQLGDDLLGHPIPQLGSDPLAATSPFNRSEFLLPGYPASAALRGTQLLRGLLSYTLPLARIERGWMSPPVAADSISASLSAYRAAVWSQPQSLPESYRHAWVAALHVDLWLFYSMPVTLTLAAVKAPDAGGNDSIYLQLGSP
ncbi:MAG: PD40 domain-containing protein [Gammaproteobacteria bacterium]|nr:PD40 domain-containing protein [Gammaproteobacteria bacterium]